MEEAAGGAEGLIQVVLLLFSGPLGPLVIVLGLAMGLLLGVQGVPGPTP